MKNTSLLILCLCLSLAVRFFDTDNSSVRAMAGEGEQIRGSFTLSDLADDIFERSKDK